MKNEQFTARYPVRAGTTENPGNRKKQQFIEQEQIRRQNEDRRDRPDMAFFEQWMYAPPAPRGKQPRVGYLCNLVPPELIRAVGAEPVRLDCGNAAAAVIGEEVLSGEICPLAKATFGAFLREDSLARTCDALIVPGSCDAKRKMGEVLSDFKPVFQFNLPAEQNYKRYAAATAAELRRMLEFLEQRISARFSRTALRQAIAQTNRRADLIRQLQDLRIKKPRSLCIRDLFLMVQSAMFRPVPPEEWIAQAQRIVTLLRNDAAERKSLRPRLVLSGAPMVWPNFKLLNVLEECGADIVADTLCTGAQSGIDPVVAEERSTDALLRALAGRYVFGALCPCFISQEKRIDRIVELYKQAEAQGVVNYSMRLCQLFDVETYRLERILKERRIPFINVRTDYSLEDTEQLRVRIEAFLETI